MKNLSLAVYMLSFSSIAIFSNCENKQAENKTSQVDSLQTKFNGYESQEKLGEHLVLIAGCHDCHTPKKMTPQGPDLDMSLALSGHPSQIPSPDIDRKEMEGKGVIATQTLTAWVGPWGVSFAGNLTSDATGIGNWKESNFFTAIRKGKFKGIETGRDLLPPMPWQMYRNMTDDELKAVFAYLKSTKPIKNVVPQPVPPVMAKQ